MPTQGYVNKEIKGIEGSERMKDGEEVIMTIGHGIYNGGGSVYKVDGAQLIVHA